VWRYFIDPRQLEKVACGPFSDTGFVAGCKRRDFCSLPSTSAIPTASQTNSLKLPTGLLFAGKNHAFCPRARNALGALAEIAAGDFSQ
jgi:hypothetical protein